MVLFISVSSHDLAVVCKGLTYNDITVILLIISLLTVTLWESNLLDRRKSGRQKLGIIGINYIPTRVSRTPGMMPVSETLH